MQRRITTLFLIVLFVSLGLPVGAALHGPAVAPPHAGAAKQFAFREAMRKLWEDHVVWTRQFVVSAVADLPDKSAAAERLLKNQADIGDAVKPFYGDAAGERLTALLKDHIMVAAELVTHIKKGDKAKADDAGRRWNANADEIAAFLSAANPKAWPAAEMKRMMREHLELTTQEVAARLRGDWAADVAAYEKIRSQILHMADMLSAGIIGQFPQKFE